MKATKLALESIFLEFPSDPTWGLLALVGDIAMWLYSPKVSPRSEVRILSSSSLMQIIQSYFGFEVILTFQDMLYAHFLAYIEQIQRPSIVLAS